MKVKAKTGVQVPREDNPRRYVSESDALEVADSSAYYLRRIADGDLERVEESAPAADAPKAAAAVKTATSEPAAPAAKSESEPTSGNNGAK